MKVGWLSRPGASRAARALACACLLACAATASAAPPPPVENGRFRLIAPASGRVAEAPVIVIETADPSGAVVLLVDGADVSALAPRDGRRLEYHPRPPLGPGPHTVQLVAAGPGGGGRAEWTFDVLAPRAARKGREVYSESSVSLSGSRAFSDRYKGRQTVTSGNLALNVGARADDTEVSLETNLGYANTVTKESLTPSGYLLSARHGTGEVAVGDVTFTGTPLTAPSLSSRGAMASFDAGGADVQLVQVNSRTVTGWKTGLGANDQIRGGAVAFGAGGTGTATPTLTAVVLDGEIQDASSEGVASVEPPSRGKVAGVRGAGRLADTGVNAELAVSSFDGDTLDAAGARRDTAVDLRLDRQLGGVNLGLNYLRAGPDYASIANPGATFDREQVGLSASTGFGLSSLSLSVSRSRDNVDHDPTRPVVYDNSAGVTYAMVPKRWPTLSVSYTAGLVQTALEPIGGTPNIDNHSVSAGLSMARTGWSSGVTVSDAWVNDRVNGDTGSRSANWTANLQPVERLNVVPTVTVTHSKHGGASELARLATLTLGWRLGDKAAVSGQAAWMRNDTTDNSVEDAQRTVALRLARDVTPRSLAGPDRPRFDLTVSYSGTAYTDRLDPARDRNDQTILFGLTMASPLKGRVRF